MLMVMMTSFIVGGFAIMLSSVATKKIFNAISIIILFYFFTAVLSTLGIHGMHCPSEDSLLIVLLNISLWGIISSIVVSMDDRVYLRLNKSTNRVALHEDMFIEKNRKDTILTLIRISVVIFQAIIALNVIVMVLRGSLAIDRIRVYIWNSDYRNIIFINDVIYYIYSYVVKAIVIYDITVNLSCAVIERRAISYLTLLNIFLYCIIMLSRIELLRVIVLFIFAIMLSNYKFKEIPSHIKKATIIILIILVVIASLRTYDDTAVWINSLQDFSIDISGSYVTFTNYLNTLAISGSVTGGNIVQALMGGLEQIVGIILLLIGIKYDNKSYIIGQYTGPAVNIGASNHFNAFYTMYLNFMDMGGIIGCIFASIILGIVFGFIYKRYLRYGSSEKLILLLTFSQIIFFGVMRWELQNLSMWIVVVLAILRYKKYEGKTFKKFEMV